MEKDLGMITNLTAEDLIAFEREIADLFNAGKIRSVIHLYSGGETDFIRIFQSIREQDWVLCGWRSHYQCLLKGVPPDKLKEKIIAGHSISLCFPEHRILSSGIFGGVLPITVGLGMAIKRSGEDAKVNCFVGDMGAESGIFHECAKYSQNHNLPIRFIVEDNGLSVCSETKKVWAFDRPSSQTALNPIHPNSVVDYFSYEPGRFPHAGSGVRVPF